MVKQKLGIRFTKRCSRFQGFTDQMYDITRKSVNQKRKKMLNGPMVLMRWWRTYQDPDECWEWRSWERTQISPQQGRRHTSPTGPCRLSCAVEAAGKKKNLTLEFRKKQQFLSQSWLQPNSILEILSTCTVKKDEWRIGLKGKSKPTFFCSSWMFCSQFLSSWEICLLQTHIYTQTHKNTHFMVTLTEKNEKINFTLQKIKRSYS